MSKRPKLTTTQRGLITAFSGLVEASPAAEAFIAQAAWDAAPDELPEITSKGLAAVLADFWAFAVNRKGSEPVIRLAPVEGAANLERIEILQDDAPFLVDSVMGEIAEQGLSVRAMFHPVVEVARNAKGVRQAEGETRRESMIQIILERVGADREAALVEGIQATLADLRTAVSDFPSMLDLMARTIDELEAAPASPNREEELEFLRWLRDEHFVYLGTRVYEYPRLKDGGYAQEEPLYQPEDGLGVLRDAGRTVLRRSSEPALLTAQIAASMAADPVTVAKSNLRSRVHRRGYMDYVGVKRYGADGKPSGEVRFVGLFTSEAYDEPAYSVPLIRAKVAGVLARAGKAPSAHNEKRLRNILETFPRDELFQASEDDLLAAALGVLHLYDRPRVRLFERRDPFDRFASVLLFVPRDRYDSGLRARAGEMLADAYGGRISAYYPAFPDTSLARVHFIIGFEPGHHAEPDLKLLETEIAAASRTWNDRFASAVRASGRATAEVAHMVGRYAEAFTAGYREHYDAEEALADIAVIESLAADEPVRIRAYRRAADSKTQFRFKLYRPGSPAPLADVLPILENMGLKAMVESGYPVTPAGGGPIWIHEFELDDQQGEHLVFDDVKTAFEDAFTAVWTGATENDGFNRMVLELSISWREAALIRALARYRQQSGLDPSQRVQETALSDYPEGRPPDPRPLPHQVRSQPGRRPRPAHRRGGRPDGGDRPGPAAGGQPRRRPGPAPHGPAGGRHQAHQLLSARRRRRLQALSQLQGGLRRAHRTAPAQALSRDLRLGDARRGRASALWSGGPWRPSLVRPPRRLPHRGPGPGQGAADQERGHRARGLQGRLLSQAASQGGRARRGPLRGGPRLHHLPSGPAGHHRQPRSRGQGDPSRRRDHS
jgi:glutamate dehydrogenase